MNTQNPLPPVPGAITLGDHLRAAELTGDAFANEQRRLARLRALRRALRLTPAGDPRANEY